MKSLANPSLAATIAFLALSCASSLPDGNEKNLAFQIDRNQLVLGQLTIAGQSGRFVVGSLNERTLLGETFAAHSGLTDQTTARALLASIWSERIEIEIVDMSEEIDAVVGSGLLGPIVAVDYRNLLITRFTHAPGDLDPGRTHRWRQVPSYPLMINGEITLAAVDLASPDTLVVPRSLLADRDCIRCVVDVEIGGVRFDDLDVLRADVGEIRIGNRLLQHFLVIIDYRNRKTTLLR